MRRTTRRNVLAGGIVGGLALAAGAGWWLRRPAAKPAVGMDIPVEFLQRGTALVNAYPVVDVHAHPGRSFLTGATPENLLVRLMRDGFEGERIGGMAGAGVTASVFAIVADLELLAIDGGSLRAVRGFEPGEALADFERQLARLQIMLERDPVALALTPDGIRDAHRERRQVAILASEGGDFVEQQLERVVQAYDAGLRSITLVHYRNNDLGDTQTEAPTHNGLTATGREVVREMNRLGMIIDLSHASLATCEDAVTESSAPVMLSHSNLNSAESQSPRFVDAGHARLVTDAGGIIGAWPSGYGSETLADFVDKIVALADAVGVEHVAIGTDMDGNYKPVLTDYADFPVLAGALLVRGMNETEVAGVLGENFLRLFDVVNFPNSCQVLPGSKCKWTDTPQIRR